MTQFPIHAPGTPRGGRLAEGGRGRCASRVTPRGGRGGRLVEGGGRLAEGQVPEEHVSRREASRMGGGTGQLTSGACLCCEASRRMLVPVCQLN